MRPVGFFALTATRRHRRSRLIAVTTAGTLTGALLAGGLAAASAQASVGRTAIAGTHPSWAVPSRRVATPDAATALSVRVYLAGRNPAGLTAYAAGVSTPGSPNYRSYLTTTEVQAQFGPTPGQLSAVRRWLTDAGLGVVGVTPEYVAVRGPLRAIDGAFAVRIASYRTPSGAVALAPGKPASVPDALSRAILTVTGLDTATTVMRPSLPPPPYGFYTAGPCSRYYGQRTATMKPSAYGQHVPWAICGYTPAQLRGAYGLAGSLATGRGVTVAIVDAYVSPTMPGDANKYATAVGDPQFGQAQYGQVLPLSFNDISECDAASWYAEQTLDVEAVHAMAPGANVLYVAASDCTLQALLDALARIVNNHLADVVTNSWSGGELGLTRPVSAAFSQVFELGAVEGIGFDFASGDCGYNNPATACGAAAGFKADQASFPTSSPWVTAVGGTTLAIGRSNQYEWETGWGDQVVPEKNGHWTPAPPGTYPDDYAFGSGGGTSTFYVQPSYQAGVVPRSLSTRLPSGRISARPMREIPDVAMDADPATGFLVGQTVKLRGGRYGFQISRVGGTSLSSPLFAGIEADAAQNTGPKAIGFANPLLYSLARSGAFHDVTDYPLGPGVRIAAARNDWTNSDTGTGAVKSQLYTFGLNGMGKSALRATKGYDDSTGLGSPGPPLVSELAAG